MNRHEEIVKDWKANSKAVFEETFTFLKELNKSGLNAKVAEMNDAAFKEINCLKCANCCKTTPAIVTRSDVKRIAKHLGIPPKTFIRKYLIEDVDGSLMTNGIPCTFLKSDNSCAIYEFRPEACRAYPHMDDFRFSNRPRINANNSLVCPAVYYVISQLKSKNPK